MSVINDMLRDLNKRQAPELSNATNAAESVIEPQASVYKKWLIIVVSLLLIAGVVFLVLMQFLSKQSEAKQVANQQTEQRVSSENTAQIVIQEGVPEKLNKKVVAVQQTNEQLEIAHNAGTQKAITNTKPISTSVAEKTLTTKQQVTPRTPSEEVRTQQVEKSDKTLTSKKPAPQIENTMKVKLSPSALDQQMAERATQLIAQGQQQEAYRELYNFIGAHQEDIESRTVLATYLLSENRMAEVGDILLNAPLSKSPKLRQIKARWFVEQAQYTLAIYTLNTDLPAIDEYPDYYVLLAAYYQRYGSAMDASKTYSKLVDYDESVADWWAGLGVASDRNGQIEKAIFAYQQALELSGLSPELVKFVRPRLKQLTDTLPAEEAVSTK